MLATKLCSRDHNLLGTERLLASRNDHYRQKMKLGPR